MSTNNAVEKFALGRGRGGFRGTLHVGLVNNMPDTAMRATELQFARLLKEAATSNSWALDVRLHLFSLGDVERGDMARSRMEGFYADAEAIPMAGIDALIVTGAEPCTDDLRQESYWKTLADLIDWAETGTLSTVFSCLAAHAAVLHLDGIERERLPRKLSGVFPAERLGGDPLQTGMDARIHVPHSRRNGVAEAKLAARGYRILSRIAAGVDSFVRDMPGRSRFVFLQGHPEYGAEALSREYSRDVGRFLRGETGERPAMPENYFDRATELALAALDESATGPDDLSRYTGILSGALPLQSWHRHTVKFFGNWLTMVAAEKMRRLAQSQPPQPRKKQA